MHMGMRQVTRRNHQVVVAEAIIEVVADKEDNNNSRSREHQGDIDLLLKVDSHRDGDSFIMGFLFFILSHVSIYSFSYLTFHSFATFHPFF